MENEVIEFLQQSNAIEKVFEPECLDLAIKAWEYLMSQDVMSIETVLNTHRIFMDSREAWDDQTASAVGKEFVGKFRNGTVYIGNKAALPHQFIDEKIEFWVHSMNCEQPEQADLETLSKHLHVLYEYIHPFWDGNGRSGRMFMNWWRIKHGLPLLIIHTGVEQYEYYEWFN